MRSVCFPPVFEVFLEVTPSFMSYGTIRKTVEIKSTVHKASVDGLYYVLCKERENGSKHFLNESVLWDAYIRIYIDFSHIYRSISLEVFESGFQQRDGTLELGNQGGAFSWKLEGSLLSLAANSSRDRVAVVGREAFGRILQRFCFSVTLFHFLKILDLDTDSVIGETQLCSGSRWNPTLSSCDVKWGCAGTRNILATASTNGSIVLWDLVKTYSYRVDRVITEHFRSVNRLAFNQLTGYWLLSASQDGTIKLWDLRDRNGLSKHTMQGRAESVRDIQFNPNSMSEFAAAFENGTVQRWDIRKPNMYERKINAHSGLTLTIDWHPDGRHIATGGRDKMIKIWDMFSEMSKPISMIQTTAPVSKVAWKPISNKRNGNICGTEIASCSLVSDYRIYIWDIRRPYIASRILDKHENVATGIIWKDENYLWSCSKDKTFIQHAISEAEIPLDSISVIGMGWSPLGNLSIVFQDRYDETNSIKTEYMNPIEDEVILNKKCTRLCDYRNSRTLNSIIGQFYRPLQVSGTVIISRFEYYCFVYLAQHYNIITLPDVSISQACENNANFALSVQKYRTSQTWKILKYFIENKNLTNVYTSTTSQNIINDNCNEKHHKKTNKKYSRTLTQDVMHETKNQVLKKIGTSFKNISLRSDCIGKHFRNNTESILLKKNDFNKKYIFDQNETKIFSNNGIYGLQNFSSDSEIVFQSFNSDYSVSSFGSNFNQEKQLPTHSDVKDNAFDHELGSINVNMIKNNASPWVTESVVQRVADYYGEKGDIQMCATIVLLMSKYMDFDTLKVEKWITEYIELLQRYRMFITMTEVINASSLLSIKALSQTETSIYINCNYCHKPITSQKINKNFSYCEYCQKIPDGCIICNIPVKGQYLWCQNCSHGGHATCIRTWFIDGYSPYGACPAIACSHHCGFFTCTDESLYR
ncbi:hypothetical protein PMAC_000681 [Pneumocystis sp. 'macacae']|nr:hypothetical protein PMAC_000681 [Pneumocystis sp. 'macacae']